MPKTDRITITQDDRRCYRMRTADETVELFGEDYLLDYGVDVPADLSNEYSAIMKQYNALQLKLRDLYESRYNK